MRLCVRDKTGYEVWCVSTVCEWIMCVSEGVYKCERVCMEGMSMCEGV